MSRLKGSPSRPGAPSRDDVATRTAAHRPMATFSSQKATSTSPAAHWPLSSAMSGKALAPSRSSSDAARAIRGENDWNSA